MKNLKITTEDVAAIKATEHALDETALSGDFKALTNLCTEDVLLMGPNISTIHF